MKYAFPIQTRLTQIKSSIILLRFGLANAINDY